MKKRRKKQKPVSEQLRQIIEGGDMSRYELSKRSGVDTSQLHRFVNSTAELTTKSLDKIGAVLNLKISIEK